MSVGDQSGLERDSVSGSVFMPIYLSEAATAPVVVSYWTVDDTATAGEDYTRWGTPASPRTATVPTGATQTQVNIPVLADDDVEGDETFSVVIGSVTGGAVLGDDTGTATIVDADSVSVDNPAITVSNPTVVEGHSEQRRAQFLIHLSRAPGTPVTVTYATSDGTAAAGGDYVAKLPGTVVFAPGQISKTIDVLVNPDTTVDGTRAFTLDVTVTGGSPVEELAMSGTATIVDDDVAPAEPCPPGSFNSTDGNEPCTPAPPGTYVDTFGATDATACPEGTTTATAGSTTVDDCVPERVGALSVAAGGSHTCALLSDGSVSCWGNNNDGQLGNGSQIDSNVPIPVNGVAGATQITAGFNHTCALLGDATVSCWGYNFYGQLGSLPFEYRSTVPVAVNGVSNAVSVSAGGNHTCAVLVGGTVSCWGHNSNGQLGDGTYTTSSSNSAVSVVGISTATAVTAGFTHSCAVLSDGAVTCWGRGSSGQLGVQPAPTRSNTPLVVDGISDAVEASAGNLHTCARMSDGTLLCWGANGGGQLGNGTFTSSNLPVVVESGMASPSGVSAGSHTCASLDDGTARCWGGNVDGRLGNGTTNESSLPVPVVGLTGTSTISAGNSHSCAVLDSGSVRCWGSNSTGQLGNGTNTNSSVSSIVSGIP